MLISSTLNLNRGEYEANSKVQHLIQGWLVRWRQTHFVFHTCPLLSFSNQTAGGGSPCPLPAASDKIKGINGQKLKVRLKKSPHAVCSNNKKPCQRGWRLHCTWHSDMMAIALLKGRPVVVKRGGQGLVLCGSPSLSNWGTSGHMLHLQCWCHS